MVDFMHNLSFILEQNLRQDKTMKKVFEELLRAACSDWPCAVIAVILLGALFVVLALVAVQLLAP